MRLKEKYLYKANKKNVIRLAAWLGINTDQNINSIIREIGQQGYLFPSTSKFISPGSKGKR